MEKRFLKQFKIVFYEKKYHTLKAAVFCFL